MIHLMNTKDSMRSIIQKKDMWRGLDIYNDLPSRHDWEALWKITEVGWTDIHLGETWGNYRFGVKFIDISPEV